jgi:cytochrome c oxidase subunit 2
MKATQTAVGLGPGFWPVTIGLTVLSVVSGIWIAYTPLDFLLPQSSLNVTNRGEDIDFLFRFMSVFGNAIFIYVAGYVIYFVIVFRRRATDPPGAVGVQIHDAPQLEFWWTVIPTILIIVLAVLSVRVWYQIQYGYLSEAAPLSVEVIGHQFNFEFRYADWSGSTFNVMHLPVNRPVRLLVTSSDVIHSFWVPEFRLKADTVPGLVQNLNFTPQREGTYLVECTEFCGVNHSEMQAHVVVESPQKFAAWLAAEKSGKGAAALPGASQLAQGDAVAGKALFEQKCTACHKIAPFDQRLVGPGLGKIFNDPAHPKLVDGDSVSPANVAKIITNGFNGGAAGTMPNAQSNGVTPKDIANLVAFLKSQK